MSSDVVPITNADAGELLVWPCQLSILATNDAAAAAGVLAFHARQHFPAVTATALQESTPDRRQQRHFLVLHFGKSWAGLRDAKSLAGRFTGAGRWEWRRQRRERAGVVHGWTAGEEDLRGDDAVGRFLRDTGAAARSAEDVDREEGSVLAKLRGMAGEKRRRARLLEARCEEMAVAAKEVQETTSWLHGELQGLGNIAENVIAEINRDVHEENEKLKAALDASVIEIKSKTEKIVQLNDQECSKAHTVALEINSLELASRVRKAENHALMLHENYKQEMEAISTKIIQLEKQLEQQREALALTMRQLNVKLQAGEKFRKEDHQLLYNAIICVRKILEEDKERLANSTIDLMKREKMKNKDLQENRQELILGLENILIGGHTVVGIKRMGELDEKPFHLACKQKYRNDDPEGKAARLVSSWQDELKKPSWHPFVTVEVDGEDKEVVDEDDPKLRQLLIDYGGSVCNAVKVALSELNEYNPHRRQRHAMNELWNFGEGRKATMAEVIRYILEQLAVANPGFQE